MRVAKSNLSTFILFINWFPSFYVDLIYFIYIIRGKIIVVERIFVKVIKFFGKKVSTWNLDAFISIIICFQKMFYLLVLSKSGDNGFPNKCNINLFCRFANSFTAKWFSVYLFNMTISSWQLQKLFVLLACIIVSCGSTKQDCDSSVSVINSVS